MNETDLILDEFLIEAGEIFDQLDLDFVALERNTTDRKLIGSIFRAMHSLKGSSRFCAFRRLERLTHYAESLLGEVREGQLALNGPIISTLLRVSDRLRALIAEIGSRRSEPEGEDSDLIAELEGHLGLAPAFADAEREPMEAIAEAQAQGLAEIDPRGTPLWQEAAIEPPGAPRPALPFTEPPVAPAPPTIESDEPLTHAGAAAPRGIDTAPPVRVSVELLDSLMDLVGEMVLARNRLLALGEQSTDQRFTGTVRSIDTITAALQERMMKTRMQPLGQLWSKFPRLVRDVSQECGKQVELQQIGGDTELDRAMIEGIRDPLMHIIRNCIDHGIEAPALRSRRNKPAHGTITLSAVHANGSVVIEVSDDGGGIDVGLVGRKALEKGLINQERLSRLTEREVLDLIFVPGFSTRDQVTNVSGRGVGMDVVKNNLQRIGGTIDISTSTAGTRFSLRIPLTLAIMPALLVRAGQQRFAVPQLNLFEIIHRAAENGEPSYELYHNVPVFRLRNRLLPLLSLGHELALDTPSLDPAEPLHIVVVQAGDLCFGIAVDEVLAMQEMVVKPVSAVVRAGGVFSGATILGDGSVSLILDVAGIAARAQLQTDLNDQARLPEKTLRESDETERIAMLIVDLDSVERVAIPLDYVDRVEMLPGFKIEHRGKEDVAVLGEQIMPLIWVSSYVDDAPLRIADPDSLLPVVVHRIHDQPIGLVVSRIRDIAGVPPMVTMVSSALRGFQGSTIVDEKVVSILDVPGILRARGLDVPSGSETMGASTGAHRYAIASPA